MGRCSRHVLVLACLLVGMGPAEVAAQEWPTVAGRGGDVARRFDAYGAVEDLLLDPEFAPPEGVSSRAAGTTTLREESVVPVATPRVTIDSMTTESRSSVTYVPATSIGLIGRADVYFLSDGSSWPSGAGSYQTGAARLQLVETDGDIVRYVFHPPADGVMYAQTDYDSGDHSAQGTLGADGPLVLEAEIGTSTAVMRGGARVLANDATWYREPRFNHYSAIVGSVVPFEVTYELLTGTWSETTFEAGFTYRYSGVVDFANALSTPELQTVELVGSRQVLPGGIVQYRAIASYEGGVSKPVSDVADWTVEPAGAATVVGGVVTVQAAGPGETFTLRATYDELGRSAYDEHDVRVLSAAPPGPGEAWGTFQGNARHTGYVPVSLEPAHFQLRWERDVAPGQPLNPVAAADGHVFVSTVIYFGPGPHLFGLDARDGATLWSKDFGRAFSVNPPAAAYGNVYVQTGNHSDDTFLRAHDGATGELVFQTPHSAQWERYLAPTIVDDTVYVNGGYYGGAYAFDAFSGGQRWFLDLPQYDEWTPAVDDTRVYAYLGRSPGLYVADRATGTFEFVIPDDNFEWNGWSMGLAPVLGDLGQVLAIHDGRLINFDPAGRVIAWELDLGFRGQPVVGQSRIYASVPDAVLVLDEATGVPQWSWTVPEGEEIQTPLVVTDSHILVSTETQVYAVGRLSRVVDWSYPLAGHIALGDGTLYIAADTGTLAAIDLGGFQPSPPVGIEIVGPAVIGESSSTPYTAVVTYADGRERDRTPVVAWEIETVAPATIGDDGVLEVGELLAPQRDVTLSVSYAELGAFVTDTTVVEASIGVDLRTFIERNLANALAIQQDVAVDLARAMALEEAARTALASIPISELGGSAAHVRRALSLTKRAISRTGRGIRAADQCVDSLEGALDVLGPQQ